jgi:hypothetical protein
MPLELGMFLGAKRYGSGSQKQKRLLIFDIDQYRYQRFISDLAGMDIHAHGGDPVRALRETRDWLSNVSRRPGLPSADQLAKLFQKFLDELPAMASKLEFDPESIPYVDFERFVVGWLVTATEPEPAG